MPVTLAQAQVNAQDDVDYAVIDNLRRYSWLMDHIVWDDTVTPGTGGSSLTYAYTRLTEAAPAGFRAFNTEYTAGQAKRQRFSVDLKPLGGAITIDRVLAHLGNPATNEVNFQIQQLMASVRTRFQQEVLFGDPASGDADGFEGLDSALTGSRTEYFPGGTAMYADWSMGASHVDSQSKALALLDEVDDWLSGLVPSTTGSIDLGAVGALPPGVKAIIGNTKAITRLKALARWSGMYTETKDDLGRQVMSYGEWTLIDAGDRADGASPIVPIESRDPDGSGGGSTVTGLTDLYAVCFGMDAFHGASMAGTPLVQTWLPDYTQAGAVKSGEIEMGPVATVLKNDRSCGVLRNIKVA